MQSDTPDLSRFRKSSLQAAPTPSSVSLPTAPRTAATGPLDAALRVAKAPDATQQQQQQESGGALGVVRDFFKAQLIAANITEEFSLAAAPEVPDLRLGLLGGLTELPFPPALDTLHQAYELALHCAVYFPQTTASGHKEMTYGNLFREAIDRPELLLEIMSGSAEKQQFDEARTEAVKLMFKQETTCKHSNDSAKAAVEKYHQAFRQFNERIISPCQSKMSVHWIKKAWKQFCQDHFKEDKECQDCLTHWEAFFDRIATRQKEFSTLVVLREALGLEHKERDTLEKRVGMLASRKFAEAEVKERLANIEHHSHYTPEKLGGDEAAFALWKQEETKRLQQMLKHLARPPNPAKPHSRPTPKARLMLVVHGARDLYRKRLTTDFSTDPYVQLEYHEKTKSTRTIRGDLNPVWEHRVTIWDRYDAGDIVLTCWDSDPLRDRFLGRVTLPVQEVRQQSSERRWHPVQKRSEKSNVSGELCVSCHSEAFDLSTAHYSFYGIYRALLHRIVAYESGRKKPALSDVAVNILGEFSYRYCISTLFHELCLLELLSVGLQPQADLLNKVAELVAIVLDDSSRTLPLTTSERNIRTESCQRVYRFVVERVAHVEQLSFAGAVKPMMLAYKAIADSPDFAVIAAANEASRPPSATDVLKECFDASCDESYAAMRESFAGDTDNKASAQLDAMSLARLASRLCSQLESYFELFAADFGPYEDVFRSAVVTRFAVLYAQDLLPVHSKSFEDMFALYFIVRKLVVLMRSAVPDIDRTVLRIDTVIRPHFDAWRKHMGGKLREWSDNAIALDPWKPLSDTHLHSSSVVDLFSSINQAHEFLLSLEWDYGEETHVALHQYFSQLVTDVVAEYCKTLRRDLTRTLQADGDGSGGGLVKRKSDADSGTRFTPALGVRLNNIFMLRTHLIQLVTMMEEEGDQDTSGFDEAFRLSKQMLRECLAEVAASMNLAIASRIERVTEPEAEQRELRHSLFGKLFKKRGKVAAHLDGQQQQEGDSTQIVELDEEDLAGEDLSALHAYINEQLGVASGALYAKLFKKLMSAIWDVIVNELEEEIVSSINEMEVKRAVVLLEQMRRFFGADDSLIKRKLKRTAEDVRELVRVLDRATPEVIAAYGKAVDEGNEAYAAHLLTLLKVRGGKYGKHDKMAHEFYELQVEK